MKESADIRRENRRKIRSLLYEGKELAKNQIALQTGLSQATVNTLLNEMKAAQEVTCRKAHLMHTGRSTGLYRLSEKKETFGGIYFNQIGQMMHLYFWEMSLFGEILDSTSVDLKSLDLATLIEQAKKFFAEKPVSQIVTALCGACKDGQMVLGDIDSLNQVPLQEQLEQHLHISVHLENDMHLSALGCYTARKDPEAVVSIGIFAAGIRPGTASVHRGMVIQGAHQFAGMPGFLDFGIPPEQVVAAFSGSQSERLIVQSLTALCVFINPDHILLTGDLIDPERLDQLRQQIGQYLPVQYLPALEYLPDLIQPLTAGIYARARQLRESPA